MSISISGMSKGEVLARLYNAARQQGLGVLDSSGRHNITVEDAQRFVDTFPQDRLYFDYLNGRVLKVDITGDILNTQAYDRDNGEGAAARALRKR